MLSSISTPVDVEDTDGVVRKHLIPLDVALNAAQIATQNLQDDTDGAVRRRFEENHAMLLPLVDQDEQKDEQNDDRAVRRAKLKKGNELLLAKCNNWTKFNESIARVQTLCAELTVIVHTEPYEKAEFDQVNSILMKALDTMDHFHRRKKELESESSA